MSRRDKPGAVDTVYGPVSPQILERLQDSFDTRLLLELVDQLDELRARVCDPEGLRADLLKLHAMAHTLINDAPLTTESEDQSIWELADDLEYEWAQIAESARRASLAIRPLVELQPDDSAL
jgi:hypothetical protein